MFVVNFSLLEHELTIVIAEFLIGDDHTMGLVIEDGLCMRNEISLFYGLSVLGDAASDHGTGDAKKLRGKPDEANIYRDRLVHASWGSLSKNGFVHTKTEVDDTDGVFKRVRATVSPEAILEKADRVMHLIDKLGNYLEVLPWSRDAGMIEQSAGLGRSNNLRNHGRRSSARNWTIRVVGVRCLPEWNISLSQRGWSCQGGFQDVPC